MFYEYVMALLKAASWGIEAPQDNFVIVISWKEMRRRGEWADWYTWQSAFVADSFHLDRLKKDEEFYASQDYAWQPRLVGIVDRNMIDDIPVEGKTLQVRVAGEFSIKWKKDNVE